MVTIAAFVVIGTLILLATHVTATPKKPRYVVSSGSGQTPKLPFRASARITPGGSETVSTPGGHEFFKATGIVDHDGETKDAYLPVGTEPKAKALAPPKAKDRKIHEREKAKSDPQKQAERNAADAKRKAAERANSDPTQKRKSDAADAKRKAAERANSDPTQKQKSNAADAKRKASGRASLDPAEQQKIKAADAERKKAKRAEEKVDEDTAASARRLKHDERQAELGSLEAVLSKAWFVPGGAIGGTMPLCVNSHCATGRVLLEEWSQDQDPADGSVAIIPGRPIRRKINDAEHAVLLQEHDATISDIHEYRLHQAVHYYEYRGFSANRSARAFLNQREFSSKY